jgi:anti-sigma factor RsiW
MSGRHPEQERIEAYLGDTMNPAERARFERDAAADPALAAEVAAWRVALGEARAWAQEPAPGAERVAHLRVPRLDAGARVVTIRSTRPVLAFAGRLAWRAAALAAVFAAGYVAGLREPSRAGSEFAAAPAAVTEARHSPAPSAVPDAPSAAEAAPTYTTEEDGRVIVQTTLPASGARVTWVVDASVQIPDAERASNL